MRGLLELVLEVSDLKQSLDFYQGVLLLAEVERWPPPREALWLSIGRNAVLGLWPRESGGEGVGIASSRGGSHVHFAVYVDPGSLPAWQKRIGDAGLKTVGPVDFDAGNGSLFVSDPDGNVVELADWAVDWSGEDVKPEPKASPPPEVEQVGVQVDERVSLRAAWDEQAEAWIRWARAPEHDTYWRFGRAAFFALLPKPGRLTLDVGCGEGRVSRDLAALGHKVIGIDASRVLVMASVKATPEIPALVAEATRLPFGNQCCDLVVAYMSLQDVDDMPLAVMEMARVLEPGGNLCLAIVHPINSAGHFETLDADAAFAIRGSYLESSRYVDRIEREGLVMTFNSAHHPLGEYFEALRAAGLAVESLREVPIDEASAAAAAQHRRWLRLPMFLDLRAVKSRG